MNYLKAVAAHLIRPLKLGKHDDVIKWKHFPALLAISVGN